MEESVHVVCATHCNGVVRVNVQLCKCAIVRLCDYASVCVCVYVCVFVVVSAAT